MKHDPKYLASRLQQIMMPWILRLGYVAGLVTRQTHAVQACKRDLTLLIECEERS
jgi:hypothetical protein